MHTFFVIAAAVLETMRIAILIREMRELALTKGESPKKWIAGTIIIWLGIEITVVLGWYLIYGWNLTIVVAVMIGIVAARVVFYFYKKDLRNRTVGSIEDKIDEIGKD